MYFSVYRAAVGSMISCNVLVVQKDCFFIRKFVNRQRKSGKNSGKFVPNFYGNPAWVFY